MSIRVAAIDSGVNTAHPHVGRIAGGVYITAEGAASCYTDFLGHGTAVAGAIREKAPDADIFAVKVFDKELRTSGQILMRALDWCIGNGMDFVNMSLGTVNPIYVPEFEERISRAVELNTTIVAAFEMQGRTAFPGGLAGVAGVLLDDQCPRDRYRELSVNGRILYSAAGFPRDIPGVPPTRNLQGISFAVANVTGFLAHAAQCVRT